MKNLVKNIITLHLDELEKYNFPLDELFGLEVINNGIKFCFIIKFSSKNKNLICCAPAAHERNLKNSKGILITPPFFHRWSWHVHFNESFIAFADPIFFYDDNITVGWFVGDENQWYLETVARIIKKLSKNQNILHDNILFYGNSSGGFSSIGLGTLIKKSKVIIDNSQFFVLDFHKGDVDKLFNILLKKFQGLSESEIIDKIKYRLDVIELFKKYEYVPPIHCYVNLESDEDVNIQCIPFINELQKLKDYSNNFSVVFYKEQKESPHGPLSTDFTIEILKSFAQSYLYNTEENRINNFTNNLNDQNIKLKNQISEMNNKIKFLKDIYCAYYEENNKKFLNTEKNTNINNIIEKDKTKLLLLPNNLSDVDDIIVYDYATVTNYNNDSYILPRGNLERTKNGTILFGNVGEIFFTPTKEIYYYNTPVTLELTTVYIKDYSHIRLQIYSKKQKENIVFQLNELNIKNNMNIKLIYDGKQVNVYIDDILKSTKNVTFTENFRIGIQTYSNDALFKYKNMKIHKQN